MVKNVFIVNPDAGERERLCRLLGADPAWQVTGLGGCTELLIEPEDQSSPDLVLIEPAALREEGAAERLAAYRGLQQRTRIIAFREPGNGAPPDLDGIETLPRPASLLQFRSLVASAGGRSAAPLPPAPRLPGFEGYLEGIPLADLIQILCVTARTGRLRLQGADGGGEISFVDGEIATARDGEGTGEGAFYRIMETPSGRFGFDDGIEPRARTIRSGWEHLLMEAMRQRDEACSGSALELPSSGETPATPGATAVDLTGRRLGPYQLVRVLERHEDGTSYEAINAAMRAHITVFVLDAGMARDPFRMRRFLHRSQVLMGIQHPNLVATIAGGECEGFAYCAEQQVEGVSLRGRLRQERFLDGGQVRAVFRDCVRGLARLHAEGLGHGRLDAGSIILGGDGVPRLGRLNGVRQQEPTLEEDVAALASTLREALRPVDRQSPVAGWLAPLAAGRRTWESLDELLAVGGRAERSAPAETPPRRRWGFLRAAAR
jgi:hypothetical protein